jgi:riboflavin synthase
MFTGIVEELGTVQSVSVEPGRISVSCSTVIADAVLGASIAVSGCCLTVVELDDRGFEADLAPETLARTTLGGLAPGDPVNLERPLRLADRLGGHLVQAHVDGVGRVTALVETGDGAVLTAGAPESVLAHLVEKGSVTVDGVSLTVTAVTDEAFSVALIPHTLAVTTLGRRAPGDPVNLEGDVVAKYVQRLLEPFGSAALRR